MQLDEYTLVDFFKVLWRRKLLWILLPVVFAVGASLYLKSKPDMYYAEGELQVDPPPEGMTFILAHWEKEANKVALFDMVFDHFNQSGNSDAAGVTPANYKLSTSGIPFDPGTWGKLIFKVDGPNPEIARELNSLWMKFTLEKGKENIKTKLALMRDDEEKNYEAMSNLYMSIRDKRDAFFRKNGLFGLKKNIKVIKKEIKNIDKKLQEARFNFEKQKFMLESWRNQLRSLTSKDNEARTFATRKSMEARTEIEAFPGVEASLKALKENAKSRLSKLLEKRSKHFVELVEVENEFRNIKKVLDVAVGRKSKSIVNRQRIHNNATLLSEASTSGIPVPKRDAPKIIAAGVTGFVMGIILALVLESFSGRRREGEITSQ